MKYTRIYSDKDGNSHFEDVEIPSANKLPGQPGFETIPTTRMFFREMTKSREEGFHTPSNKQFLITVGGEVDIVASDGTTRRFGQGDIFLADDLTGKGHVTKVVDGKMWSVVFVRLE